MSSDARRFGTDDRVEGRSLTGVAGGIVLDNGSTVLPGESPAGPIGPCDGNFLEACVTVVSCAGTGGDEANDMSWLRLLVRSGGAVDMLCMSSPSKIPACSASLGARYESDKEMNGILWHFNCPGQIPGGSSSLGTKVKADVQSTLHAYSSDVVPVPLDRSRSDVVVGWVPFFQVFCSRPKFLHLVSTALSPVGGWGGVGKGRPEIAPILKRHLVHFGMPIATRPPLKLGQRLQ